MGQKRKQEEKAIHPLPKFLPKFQEEEFLPGVVKKFSKKTAKEDYNGVYDENITFFLCYGPFK